ncbi:MAG TPA: hypothetical protein VMB66_04810 [Candidatus Acidoferrales bacterium]|nr:hypothetical protein [Candidatus Acidoferrales bacterium]
MWQAEFARQIRRLRHEKIVAIAESLAQRLEFVFIRQLTKRVERADLLIEFALAWHANVSPQSTRRITGENSSALGYDALLCLWNIGLVSAWRLLTSFL